MHSCLLACQPPVTIFLSCRHCVCLDCRPHPPTPQALLPGAAKLGLHKGEPYYSRSDLQDLHTRQHWRRLGRDVKQSELQQPAKLAKKRAVPAAAAGGSAGQGGRGGSRGGFRGGWGAWQCSKSAGSADLDGQGSITAAAAGAAADEDFDADGELPAAAAAAAAGGEGAAAAMQELYGLWQTEEWEPPPAVDGKVPRNEHGNVEVPPFANSLPRGESAGVV
jgi:xeroderma pigmentosum group C-complementing protein